MQDLQAFSHSLFHFSEIKIHFAEIKKQFSKTKIQYHLILNTLQSTSIIIAFFYFFSHTIGQKVLYRLAFADVFSDKGR